MEQRQKDVTVAAVMTAPRYEAVYARNMIERALHGAGVPLMVSGGVFYGQCMQIMLEKLVEAGDVDYAITVDFDSMFTAEHVKRMLSIVAQESQIDALAAIQPKRGHGEVLSSRDSGGGETIWEGEPLKVRTAHFGLTVIDLKKLANVKKPWFHAMPNDDGCWTDGKIDDDASFWFAWEKAGNSIYLDPGCRLGHLEEMVSVFDERMQLTHMYPKEWEQQRGSTVD